MILLNKQKVEFKQFPNGELYFNNEDLYIRQVNYIAWEYENNEDLIKLMFLKRYLDDDYRTVNLYIKYLPYSRMDRKNPSYPFTLKYICEFINNLNFFNVTIQDVHSDVSSALLNKSTDISWVVPTAKKLIETLDIDTIFYPDAGAQKRFNIDFDNIAVGFKQRDFRSGKIVDYKISGKIFGNVMIVDDMCSRGGTFIEAVKHFPKVVNKIYLLVSYLEENVFTGNLEAYITKVFHNNKVSDNFFIEQL